MKSNIPGTVIELRLKMFSFFSTSRMRTAGELRVLFTRRKVLLNGESTGCTWIQGVGTRRGKRVNGSVWVYWTELS